MGKPRTSLGDKPILNTHYTGPSEIYFAACHSIVQGEIPIQDIKCSMDGTKISFT